VKRQYLDEVEAKKQKAETLATKVKVDKDIQLTNDYLASLTNSELSVIKTEFSQAKKSFCFKNKLGELDFNN